MKTETRKSMDCSEYPGSNCTLKISGTEKEVLDAGVLHGVSVHGFKDTAEFRNELKKSLKIENEANKKDDQARVA